MKDRVISVTEASRNFAECVNRVRYQGLSYLLVKNGTLVARLVPVGRDIEAEQSLSREEQGKMAEDEALPENRSRTDTRVDPGQERRNQRDSETDLQW